jgi:uncharacterized membrane protein (DUF485 family)
MACDWEELERCPEYRGLVRSRRRLILPAIVLALCAYFGFLVAARAAPNALGTRLFGGFNLGFALIVGLFVLVWLCTFGYARIAARLWDGQADRVIERAGLDRPRPAAGPTDPAEVSR